MRKILSDIVRKCLYNTRAHTLFAFGAVALATLSTIGCRDLVNEVKFPSDIVDPKAVKNPKGALALYAGVTTSFSWAFTGSVVRYVGLMTDEVTRVQGTKLFPEAEYDRIDARLVPDSRTIADPLYKSLHEIRISAQETRGVLRKYAEVLPQALTGHLMALEAMAMIYLADIYCSGIPLSRLDFERDYTLTPGFRTEEVYIRAVQLLDSAAPLVIDSARLAHFVAVGKARALLALGNIDEAQNAIADVPTSFVYTLAATRDREGKYVPLPTENFDQFADQEGHNGLPFRTSNDPRTTLPHITNRMSPIVVSSGIEARLVEAEALLLANDPAWLTVLNTLRTTCTDASVCPTPAPRGTGGVAGLALLDDPAPGAPLSDVAARAIRLDLVFAERAYWLYLTGHRQGDLRRLIRNYTRSTSTVYPIGPYWFSGYGMDVTLPVPFKEESYNNLYTGCENREA